MLIADTHVHLYPSFAVDRVFDAAHRRLSALAEGPADAALFLAERHDCHYFRDQPARIGDWTREGGAHSSHRVLVRADGARLHLFAGRQVATRERLEVLACLTDAPFPDGESLEDTLRRVWDAGGFPVMPWSRGKWLFARGRRVRRALESGHGPGALGDMVRRPRWWPEPLLSLGRRLHLPILAGTDPLPDADPVPVVGRYASRYAGRLDWSQPVDSLRHSWLAEPERWTLAGARTG